MYSLVTCAVTLGCSLTLALPFRSEHVQSVHSTRGEAPIMDTATPTHGNNSSNNNVIKDISNPPPNATEILLAGLRHQYQRELLSEKMDIVRTLLSRSFDFSAIGQGIRLILGDKQLNKRNLKLTIKDVLKLLPLLHSESFEDRMYVWGKTATLKNGLRGKFQESFSVEALDRIEGDMIFNRAGIDLLLDLYSVSSRKQTDSRVEKAQHQQNSNNRIERVKRKITANSSRYWSGPIRWKIVDKNLTQYDLEVIKDAIKHWESLTCVRFTDISDPALLDALALAAPNRTANRRRRPRPNPEDRVYLGFPKGVARNPSASASSDPAAETPHLRFVQGQGCYSYVGSIGRGQEISLGEGCAEVGIVAHELGHAIGFFHEHVRPDRDLYIDIFDSNILPGHDLNFEKKDWGHIITNGVPYDYSSLMHYSGTEWSTNGRSHVIQAKDIRMQRVLGQRRRLSFLDAKMANYHFCSHSCIPDFTLEWDACAHGGYRNPNDCSQCMCPEGWAPPTCQEVQTGQNADCGKTTLVATLDQAEVTSPTFENSDPLREVFCAWHIKAPAGKRIQLTIELQFLSDYDLPYCEGYLEVRFKNVDRPGPRLCSTGVTTHKFLTFDNEVMLLFHTLPDEVPDSKTMWFRATYELRDGCGGCTKDQVAVSVPVCKKLELYDCSQDVEEDCGEGQTCTGRRENKCYRETPFCCPPYRLKGDECQYVWGRWSEWRACSATCGGCGWRLRERICLRSRCRGRYIQWQRCGMRVCPAANYMTAKCRAEYLGGCVINGRREQCVRSRPGSCTDGDRTRRCCGGLIEDTTSGQCVEAPSGG